MKSTITFTNRTGKTFLFPVHALNAHWNPVPGVYIFLKPSVLRPGYWEFLYAGQTDSFKARLNCHERLNDAISRGCTAIAATVLQSPFERDEVEREVIEVLKPPMNVQHVGLRQGLLGSPHLPPFGSDPSSGSLASFGLRLR